MVILATIIMMLLLLIRMMEAQGTMPDLVGDAEGWSP
jgi:hypothetical protein